MAVFLIIVGGMDFKVVLKLILDEFQKENVRYALMGGFALGVLGVPRATVDMDFLVHRDDLFKIEKIMKDNNYECVYKTENVSQYISSLKIFGEIDFLHAFREISVGMLQRATEKDIFGEGLKIRVLSPEDIIGLKLQALANDETRTLREYSDIEALMENYNVNLDWNILEEYFTIFSQIEKYKELKGKFYRVK